MSGQLFDYAPGHIDVRFRHEALGFDGLRMMIRAAGGTTTVTEVDDKFKPVSVVCRRDRVQRLSCPITSVFCPFPGILAWLEAIAAGVYECATEWDAEGPDVRLAWRGCMLDVEFAESYRREQEWLLREYRLKTRAERKQVVGVIYAAFRHFVESSDYDPRRYERCSTAGDDMMLALGRRFSEEEIRGLLLLMDAPLAEFFIRACELAWYREADSCADIWEVPSRTAVQRTLGGLLSDDQIQRLLSDADRADKPLRYELVPRFWNRFGIERRQRYLRELLSRPSNRWFGTSLRSLRSQRIEQWLGAA